MEFLGELWLFMRVRKEWRLSPIVGTLGLLVVLTQGSPAAPFIYVFLAGPRPRHRTS